MEGKDVSYLLEVNDLETSFFIKGVEYNAVDRVSLKVRKNQVIGIVGESGCGKSVLSLSIMNLLPKGISRIRHGEIIFQGKRIDTLREEQLNDIRGKDISMIFQEPMTSLNPVLTIGDQLTEVFLTHTKMSKKEAEEECVLLLKEVGIPRPESVIREYPHQLSGGMRQRVMIAMAIACKPKLLIADEPTTALDVTVQAQILELLKHIQKTNEMSIMLITHDLGIVAEMCDEVIVMYAGTIVERADVCSLFYHAKHPYTQLLIHSIPRIDEEVSSLSTIDGIVPSLTQMPKKGCRFVDRCPKAMRECREVTPTLSSYTTGHDVACLLYEQVAR
ncbi:ABC transporter ATP-binding protein [Anoxybacillus gonensis]|uniref:ABC transporter ATP-binding protein n=1 Tax=Anoxybacillus gonensis TaxID=198467 RepID=UPI0029FCA94E|nr:ABC transporter ATP-binding protein [Anoxybacillus gonensis]